MTQFPLFLIATTFAALTLTSSLARHPAGDGPFVTAQDASSRQQVLVPRADPADAGRCRSVPVCFGRRPALDAPR